MPSVVPLRSLLMTSPAALRCALYARVSSEQQVEDDTIASQLDQLELRFLDDGFRGESLRRPGLERLRDVAAAGGIDRLYIQCPDRLARDYPYQMVLVDELRHHGIEIVFLNRNLDESPEVGPISDLAALSIVSTAAPSSGSQRGA
jgi:site-specific DNA recombinase